MRTRYSKILAWGLSVVAVGLTLSLWAETARADFLDDAIAAIDTAEPSLQLAAWKDIYESCKNNSDIVSCMEKIAEQCANSDSQLCQDIEQSGGNVQEVMNIFVDLENKDYTKLISDASQTIACAVANLLTGIDICGAIEGLYNDAKAVYDWFAGLFGGCSGNACNGVPLGSTSAYACNAGQRAVPAPLACQNPATATSDQCGKVCGGANYCQVTCSYCPLGQALVGPSDITKIDPNDFTKLDPKYNTCGFCPGKTTVTTQSPDKLCWTTSGNNATFPAPDGSTCITNGGWGQTPVCCKPGQTSPSSGVCAPACDAKSIYGGTSNSNSCVACAPGTAPQYSDATTSVGICVPACAIGSVFDVNSGACKTCSNGSYAIYHDVKTSSVGVCSQCTHGMNSVDKGAACACPSGYTQQQGANSQCTICPANTYQNFAICSTCPPSQYSNPGSTYCKPLSCGSGTHPANHQCLANQAILPPVLPQPGASGRPAWIPGGNNAVKPGISGPATGKQENTVVCGAGTHLEGTQCVPDSTAPQASPCPPLSRWTGEVCIGPRGKHFCPEGMTMQGDTCVRGQAASVCPPLSTWTGAVCIGPRGKHFCPEGMTMQGDACVAGQAGPTGPAATTREIASPCPPLSTWTGQVCIGPRGKHFCPEGMTMRGDTCMH